MLVPLNLKYDPLTSLQVFHTGAFVAKLALSYARCLSILASASVGRSGLAATSRAPRSPQVSEEEQNRRLEARIEDQRKIWKLSPMDLKSYGRWYDYSRARDDMFKATDTPWAPWHVVRSDDKNRARLNVISHFLSRVPHEESEARKAHSAKAAEGSRLRRARLFLQVRSRTWMATEVANPLQIAEDRSRPSGLGGKRGLSYCPG